MKNIGLLNIQRCDSHGAVLLAYAMEKVISSLGYNVNTIDYKYAGRIIEKNKLKKICAVLLLKVKKQLRLSTISAIVCGKNVKKEFDYQRRSFNLFREKYLHLTREITEADDSIFQEYHGYIVGSDVVWKPEIVRCEDRHAYFLMSVPDNKTKISYAGSIGTDREDVLLKYKELYKESFNCLDYISIREQSMISYIQSITSKEVVSTIDPVFLLNQKDYSAIESCNIDKTNYIYLYLLSGNEEAIRIANQYAEKHNTSIIVDLNEKYHMSKLIKVDSECVISAGPAEFIYNIRHAKYVFTDSFHATAFSLLFNIPLCVFDRGEISVRMRDLLARFKLEKCLYSNGNTGQVEIEWTHVNDIISKEKADGLEYLKGALSDV